MKPANRRHESVHMRREQKKWVLLEEYKGCGCSYMSCRRDELPGYCQRHGTDRRRVTKLPAGSLKDEDLGYAGVG